MILLRIIVWILLYGSFVVFWGFLICSILSPTLTVHILDAHLWLWQSATPIMPDFLAWCVQKTVGWVVKVKSFAAGVDKIIHDPTLNSWVSFHLPDLRGLEVI